MEYPEGGHPSPEHTKKAPEHLPSQVNDYVQSRAPFFGRLPPEIRHQIYEAVLHSAGLTQHIYKSDVGHSAAVTHTRCYIDPDDEDVREQRYYETFSEEEADTSFGNDQNIYIQRVWRGRQYTDWCKHWRCEETSEPQQSSSFLGPMLTCKRMHDEFVIPMYSNLTFSFINTPALSRFLATTSSRHLSLIRSIHLIWCASLETHSLDEPSQAEDYDENEDKDAVNHHEGVDNIQTWKTVWSQLALSSPRLSHVRIWIYGRFARFPMPAKEYFQVLDDFANGNRAEQAPRVMDRFTVQTVWTREFDGLVVDGQEVHEDDGEIVPDWLRGRSFEVSRVPAVEYEPETWMAMWARPQARDTGGQGLGVIRRGKGWGIRGKALGGEGGRSAFVRA